MLSSPVPTGMIDKTSDGGSDSLDMTSSNRTSAGLTVPSINLGEIVDRVFGKDKSAPLPLAIHPRIERLHGDHSSRVNLGACVRNHLRLTRPSLLAR